jgi:hypothetical protein
MKAEHYSEIVASKYQGTVCHIRDAHSLKYTNTSIEFEACLMKLLKVITTKSLCLFKDAVSNSRLYCHYHHHYHHGPNILFLSIAAYRRFCHICPELDHTVFTSSDFAIIIFYTARSSALHPTPNLEDQVPVFMSPQWLSAQFYPQAPGSLFVAPYDSKGCGGGIRTRLHTGSSDFMMSNNWKIAENELERVCKEVVEGCYEMLHMHLPGRTEENHIIPQ